MTSYTPVKLAFKLYEAEGVNRDEVPIIFMHGMTASKENFADLPEITARKTKRKVYAIDFRNHGDSEWTDIWNFDCNVDDLLHFMDTQGIRRAILIGHSMGAVAAFHTALRAPERVEKIFAEDMTTKTLSRARMDDGFVTLGNIKRGFESLPAGLSEREAKMRVLQYSVDHMPEELKQLIKWPPKDNELLNLKPTEDGRYASKANLDVFLRVIQEPYPLSKECEGQYEGPTTIAYGKLSHFQVNADEDHIKRYFPNAELVCVDEATHTVHSDCPKEFQEALFKFLL